MVSKRQNADEQIKPSPRPTASEMTAVIHGVTAEWIAEKRIERPRDVGDGHCYDFAQVVMERLGLEDDYFYERGPVEIMATEDFWQDDFCADLDLIRARGEQLPDDISPGLLANLLGAATHQWLRLDGLCYDASCPDGAARFLDMPFFKDQIDGLRNELRKHQDVWIVDSFDGDYGKKRLVAVAYLGGDPRNGESKKFIYPTSDLRRRRERGLRLIDFARHSEIVETHEPTAVKFGA